VVVIGAGMAGLAAAAELEGQFDYEVGSCSLWLFLSCLFHGCSTAVLVVASAVDLLSLPPHHHQHQHTHTHLLSIVHDTLNPPPC
jgi:hypothetical protein